MGKIFNILGTPNETNWPGASSLPGYIEFEAREPLDLKPLFSHNISENRQVQSTNNTVTPDLSLFLDLVALNPLNRPSASQVNEYE